MEKQLIKILSIILCVIVFMSCGDDGDETPDLTSISSLAGDWIDETISSGGSGGLLVLNFNMSDSSATVYAATQNDAEISCEDLYIRNIAPSGDNSFTGEGLLSSGSGFEDITLTLLDANTMEITWNCSACNPTVDVLTKLTNLSDAIPIEISNNIDVETTFFNIICDPEVPDYLVTDLISVREHLTVQPGVTIAFEANAGMDITDVNADGSLSAEGTGSQQIKFTGLEKEAGFWRGLSFESNDVRNRLTWVTVEYAGSDPIVTYGTGIALHAAVAIESESGFNGSLSIERSTISNTSGYGLIVEEGTLLRKFEANAFINNSESALRIDANNVGAIDAFSDFMGGSGGSGTNGFNGVEINASGSPIHDITADATWPGLANEATFRVAQSFDVEAELTILEGAIIEFEANQTATFKQDLNTPLGALIAKGTVAEPITFTGVEKTVGYWRGLVIQSNSVLNEMDHCIVEYGGSDPIAGELANIGVEKDGAYASPALKISNSTIRHSAGCGIVIEAGDTNFTASDITYNDNAGSNLCQ